MNNDPARQAFDRLYGHLLLSGQDAAWHVFKSGWEAREQPAPAQEPVAWRTKVMLKTTGYMWNYTEAKVKGPDGKDLVDYEPLYTSPQRTQVGLTDEEIEVIAARTLFPVDFARAIEAKLKEKNT